MKITSRERDGVTILDCKGKITIGVGDVALREAVQAALAGTKGSQEEGASDKKNPPRILINLQGVSTIDSSGIGELVAAYTTVSNRGGKLKLSSLPAKVNDILQITQLITVFEVHDNEDEAVSSF